MEKEKFCLRWNDFERNISSAFKGLREDKHFFDVTLACANEQIQAHKVILSACSPHLCEILQKNPHQHPLLYLRGIKSHDLQAVLNFMYYGEVNVAQEELNSFLAVAEDLQVKGLTQDSSTDDSSNRQEHLIPEKHLKHHKVSSSQSYHHSEFSNNSYTTKEQMFTSSSKPLSVDKTSEEIQEIVHVKTETSYLSQTTQDSNNPTSIVEQQNIHESEERDVSSMEEYESYGEYGNSTQYEPYGETGGVLEGDYNKSLE